MVHAVGIDIVEVARMEADIAEYGDRFINRILSTAERERFDQRVDQAVFLAGRFAGKEALIKALGYSLSERPPYAELEILNDATGRPECRLPGHVLEKLGPVRCLISITHEKHYAAAVAIITEK